MRELANDPETQIILGTHFPQQMRKRGIVLVGIASTLSRGAVTEDQGPGAHGDLCRVQLRDDEGKSINLIIDMNQDDKEIWLVTAI